MNTENPTPEQIAKLPKWAREHLENQVRIATRCQSKLQELLDNATPSDCWLSEHTIKFGQKFYLPSDRITFALGDGCELSVCVDNGRLKIMENGSRHGRLDIKPEASNVVTVGVS